MPSIPHYTTLLIPEEQSSRKHRIVRSLQGVHHENFKKPKLDGFSENSCRHKFNFLTDLPQKTLVENMESD